MSDSEEEDNFRLLGTPLDPIEEGDIRKKKPFGIQDQIATDKHGRRRFHGAFTGGFSAGHFNSVGTPEGWKPSTFKSSRSAKQEAKGMRPEDFMDDEDMDDFGIAPSVVRAKSEYSGSKIAKKRDRVNFRDGPIPGEPVLHSILEPSKDTVGVILLTKMGWKPGQGIGPRISKMEKRMQKRKTKQEAKAGPAKIYGCAPKPPSSSEESDGSDDELNIDLLFAPDDVDVAFAKSKSDVFGLGYSGLDRTSVLSTKTNEPTLALPDTFRMLDKNKKLAIRGQAFGVGAFEEEDADIYARDDMSQYDFALDTPASLREKRRQERAQKEGLLAITGSEDVIEGFIPAKKQPVSKKYFAPPTLPPGYQPYHHTRKSRFGPESTNPPPFEVKEKKHVLNPEDRSIILGEKSSRPRGLEHADEATPTDESVLPDPPNDDPKDNHNFRPFVSDPRKQARYEKYLQLIKIGAKDAFKSMQPNDMSEWEKERERTEFDQAAKLYRPLSGMMADRFAPAELPDESLDLLAPVAKMAHSGVSADMVAAAEAKMFGKLTRTTEEWVPVSLLCKRMNIPEPLNRGGKSLCDIAKDKNTRKSKFSVFDILVNSDNPFKSFEKTESSETPRNLSQEEAKEIPADASGLATTDDYNLSETITKIHFDDPAEKKDLFKAIFCDSDDEEDEEKPTTPAINIPVPPKPSEISSQNVLRNTSPPRGIFANLNFEKLNEKKPPDPPPGEKKEEPSPNIEPLLVDPNLPSEDLYGPVLPNRPIFVHKHKNTNPASTSSSSSSNEEDEWVEKNSSSSKKKKKKKNKDHHKEKKHKRKHKKHKEHKRKHKDKKS